MTSRFLESDFLARRGRGAVGLQTGRGLSNFLGTSYKAIAPHIKAKCDEVTKVPIVEEGLSAAGKTAANAGIAVAVDSLKGRNKKLGVAEAKQAINSTIEDAVRKGRKRKSVGKSAKGKKKQRRANDIFDEDF